MIEAARGDRIVPQQARSDDRSEGEDLVENTAVLTGDDVVNAQTSRPDLSDENSDGLDAMENATRRGAEALPLDKAGRD